MESMLNALQNTLYNFVLLIKQPLYIGATNFSIYSIFWFMFGVKILRYIIEEIFGINRRDY